MTPNHPSNKTKRRIWAAPLLAMLVLILSCEASNNPGPVSDNNPADNGGAQAPGAPTDLALVGETGSNSLVVTWTPPDPGYTTNGVPATITHYLLRYSNLFIDPNDYMAVGLSGSGVRVDPPVAITAPPVTIVGLCPGCHYYFRIQAVNSAGYSGPDSEILHLDMKSALIIPDP